MAMKLRTISAGLVALCVLAGGSTEVRSLLSYLLPHQQREQPDKREYRSSTLARQEALALYSLEQRKTSFETCADQFPRKRPLDIGSVPAMMRPLPLCSDNFAVLYSQTSKTPLVVIERLTAAQLRDAKGEERTNRFYPDPRVPKGSRAELSDYRGQSPAVDRGHQAPAGDAPTPRAMAQSFALSNMVPQSPESNRKAWNGVEMATRKFAQRAGGNVFVFTGPIFDKGHDTIGENEVWVPTRLFKLVYDESSGRAWAYILPNAQSRVKKPVDYRTFVQQTGLSLLDGVAVTGSAGHL
jgi:endonuclease G